jgi:hypothetical protein
VQLSRPADVAQPTFTFFDRLEAESIAIEAPRAIEISGRERNRLRVLRKRETRLIATDSSSP